MRIGIRTQMMTVIVDLEMERITSTYIQEVKSTELGHCLLVGSKREEGVKDDRQVSVLGDSAVRYPIPGFTWYLQCLVDH